MADRYKLTSTGPTGFGRRGAAISPDNNNDLAEVAKAIVVSDVSGGNFLEVLPADNADGVWMTFNDVQVGFMPPYQVRRVGTNTTCAVQSVLDRDVG